MHIITGGAGFIGSAFVWNLNQHGVDDLLLVDALGTDDKWKNLRNLRFRDLIHPDEFAERLEKKALPASITAITHLGACSSTVERDADYLYKTNTVLPQKIALFALSQPRVRLIHASSAATYGDGQEGYDSDPSRLPLLKPLNMYAYSKHRFDLWAHQHGCLGRFACLKFFNVYGPNEYHKGDMASVVYKAFHQIKATGQLKLFRSYHPEYPHGGQKRDFVYVKDVARLLLWFLRNPDANGIFNVGSGEARTWNDLAAAVFAALNLPPNVEYIDMPAALRAQYQYFTQAPMEWLGHTHFAHRLTTLEEGVPDYVRHYLETPDAYLHPKAGGQWQDHSQEP